MLDMLQQIAEKAVKHYALPADVSVVMINLSENATYRVQAGDGRRWALRVHREGYHSKTAIASELAWLMDLRAQGVVVTPRPVKGLNGEIIQDVSGRHVVLSDWETGSEPGIGEDLSKPFEVLGEVTARMHLHARQWKRPVWFQRHTWDFETSLGEAKPHWGRWRDGMGVDAKRAKLFGRTVDLIGKRLKAYGQDNERFGLIHCDLRLANLLIDDGQVKVIDFDDCGFGWYMFELATALFFHVGEDHYQAVEAALLAGYRSAAPLSEADWARLPLFMFLRSLTYLGWVASRPETETAREGTAEMVVRATMLAETYLATKVRRVPLVGEPGRSAVTPVAR